MKKKMYRLHELHEAMEDKKEKEANDPKHLQDGLSSREEMSRWGYGKNERIEKAE